jgi:parallel beta-helix repeat protein
VVTFSNGEDANCVLAGFTITGGKSGIYCSGSSPTITNCTITRNWDAAMGGGIYIEGSSSPTLTNCTIINNSASSLGGGIFIEGGSSPTLTNCNIINNSASSLGGGISIEGGSSPTLTNCTIINNSASPIGGGMFNQSSSATLTNCTFSGNSGRGIFCASGDMTLTNCILWGDSPDEIQVFAGTSTITFSDIQGGFGGEGNIDTDPCFADPNSGDYHLKSEAGRWDANEGRWAKDDVTSPCIDAGDPNSDWTAELWPHGKRVNMGAFGGTPQASMSLSTAGNVADINDDDAVNGRDLRIFMDMWLIQAMLLAEDINRDGAVNLPDLALLAEQWLWRQ